MNGKFFKIAWKFTPYNWQTFLLWCHYAQIDLSFYPFYFLYLLKSGFLLLLLWGKNAIASVTILIIEGGYRRGVFRKKYSFVSPFDIFFPFNNLLDYSMTNNCEENFEVCHAFKVKSHWWYTRSRFFSFWMQEL